VANKRDSSPSSRSEARIAGLTYVSDLQPGIRRVRHGKSFIYRDADGRRITERGELERIRKLAIPPAYEHVWICAHASGHLQATGRDARGRKQYRYHPRWRALRDEGKFGGLPEFGALLPTLRRRVRHDLAQPGLPRENVLALVVRLLEETLIRVGNERYTRDNRSYGLTTLRSRHVRTVRGRLRFIFRGKSGQMQETELDDSRLSQVVRHLQQLPGQKLFQYLDGTGHRQPVDSGEVNDYLRAACGSDFSAKDFRTWGGTLEAARILAQTPRPAGGEPVQRATLAEAIKQVAAALGNTPAVCRASYIHPQIIEGWLDGSLHAAIPLPVAAARPRQLETAVLRFLRRRLRTTKRSPTASRRLKNSKRA